MTKKSNFEQIIADILDCFPKSKRHIYELMLRRCNFTDPGEPLFPIMLFLLFVQDNLKDGTLTLSDEVKNLSKKIKENHGTVSVPGTVDRFWKYAAPVIIALQLILSSLTLGMIHSQEHTVYQYAPSENACNAEIQSINKYWDAKIEHINKENNLMNRSEMFSDNIFEIMIPMLLLLIILITIQITMAIVTIIKLHRSNSQIEDAGNQLQRNFDMLLYPKESSKFLHFSQNSPMESNSSSIPAADISGWGDIDSGQKDEL